MSLKLETVDVGGIGKPYTQTDLLDRACQGLDKYISDFYAREAGVGRTLRDRQMPAFEEVRNLFAQGKDKGYVKLPTGVGKTVLFSEIIEATGLNTMVVVPTTILISQTGDALSRFAPDISYGRVFTNVRELGEQVTITTYSSLVAGLRRGFINPENYQLLVLDEGHRGLSKLRADSINQFPGVLKLGFSATPSFSPSKNLGELLENKIYEMNIGEAVEQGMLAPFTVWLAKTEADLSKVKITSNGEYNQQELERIINIHSRNKAAVDLFKQLPGGLAIAYCTGVKHAEALAELFRQNGVSAAAISGKKTSKEKTAIIDAFSKGEIRVICNSDLLIEGFDQPQANICLNLQPTLSHVTAEQRGGRVLRLDPNNPNKDALIVDFLDKVSGPRHPISFAAVAKGAQFTKQLPGNGGDSSNGGRPRVFSGVEIEVEGLEVITEVQEVMRIANESIREINELSTKEWISPYNLEDDLGRSGPTIKKMANGFRTEHPEWFQVVAGKRSGPMEYIHHDLVEKLREQIAQLKKPPSGWLLQQEVAILLGRSRSYTRASLISFRNQYSDLYGWYTDNLGRPCAYYAPDLAQVMRKELPKAPKVEEGWLTISATSHRLKKSHIAVKNLADKYRSSHSEWFQPGLDEHNRSQNFLAPELVKIINEEVSGFTPPPKGWMSATKAAKDLKVDVKRINRIKREFRVEHSDWFSTHETQNFKRPTEYSSPEFLEAAKGIIDAKNGVDQRPDEVRKPPVETVKFTPKDGELLVVEVSGKSSRVRKIVGALNGLAAVTLEQRVALFCFAIWEDNPSDIGKIAELLKITPAQVRSNINLIIDDPKLEALLNRFHKVYASRLG